MLKDPDTGRRVSRPNPKSEWQSAAVPELAIVSRDLFHAAQQRKQARGCTHPNYQRRPRHILSGLLRCGACSSGMSTNGRDKSGRIRIRCSAATESGTCPDPKTFYLETVEKAVLSGLSAELRHPEVIAEYVKTYHEERKRLAAESDAKRMRLQRRLGEISREIDRLVDGIAKGVGDPNVLGARMNVLSTERKTLSAEFEAEPPPVNVLALHPAVLERYAEQLGKLQDALAKGINAGDSGRGGSDAGSGRDCDGVPRHLPPRWCRSSDCGAADGAPRRACLSQWRQRSVGKGGSGGALPSISRNNYVRMLRNHAQESLALPSGLEIIPPARHGLVNSGSLLIVGEQAKQLRGAAILGHCPAARRFKRPASRR